MDKKIKTITFSNAHNYGAVLQAYALQEVLSKNGNDVEIINYKDKIIGSQYKVIKFNKNVIASFIKNIVFFPINIKRFWNFRKFEKEMLNLTQKKYKSEEELKEYSPEADVYITGSDQVWNSHTTLGLKDSYTLNFGKSNVKRLSYAASIGNLIIKEQEIDAYRKKISKLDYISVREEDAKNILTPIINKDIEVVLDPTLLLTKEEWEKNIEKFNIRKEKEKYILAYVVQPDQEYIKIVNELSEREKIKVIHFAKTNRKIKNVRRRAYTDGPLEFISLIRNAEYVVCTSFHATVFSIIFNKKFFVVPHRKTGSRVTNLLKKLGIEKRAVNSVDEFNSLNYDENINYELVNRKIEVERQKSITWLNNAINN